MQSRTSKTYFLHVFILCGSCLAFSMTGCTSIKGPSLSGDVSRMSADTLCYRQAFAKNNDAANEEIARRRINCKEVLEEQRPVGASALPY